MEIKKGYLQPILTLMDGKRIHNELPWKAWWTTNVGRIGIGYSSLIRGDAPIHYFLACGIERNRLTVHVIFNRSCKVFCSPRSLEISRIG